MKNYKIQCLKFKAYKALRVILSTVTCFTLFYCSIAVDGGINVALCALFTSALLAVVILKKTSLFEKIYTNDGVKIERV